jgi:hypothetical protein
LRRDLFGVGMAGEVAAEGHVHAEEADALFAREEVAVPRGDEAARARRFLEPGADIGDAGSGVVPRKDEGEEVGGVEGGN